MNTLDFLKNGSGIHIKKKNKGKFTSYCGGKVTDECIRKAKASGNPTLIKRATFALNSRRWKHLQGGILSDIKESFNNALYKGSSLAMLGLENLLRGSIEGSYNIPVDLNKESEFSTALDTYLLPRGIQEKYFLKLGYFKGTPLDYGLVKKAVGNRNLPVYQKYKDVITRDKLTPIESYLINGDNYLGNLIEQKLTHAGDYPIAIYQDKNGNIFYKAWDLNDYGGKGGSTAKELGSTILDVVGNPVVVTTGFLPLTRTGLNGKPIQLNINQYKDMIKRNPIKNKLKLGGLIKAQEGTKFLSKLWFQNAGKNVNNFLSSDVGKFAIQGLGKLYSGTQSELTKVNIKDLLLRWKLAYINSISPQDFSLQVAEEERLIKLANPDYNISPIVTTYKENILATQAANKAKQKASQEADLIIMLLLLNLNELSSSTGGGFGSLLTEGLGLAGQFLSSKKSNNTGTNTGTTNLSTSLNGSPSTYNVFLNNTYTLPSLKTPVLNAPTIPTKYMTV